MARALDGLNLGQAGLLLRCQQAREDRARLHLLQAERKNAAAVAEAEAAGEALAAQLVRAEQERVAAHHRLRGRVVEAGDIEALASFEDSLAAETEALLARRRAAEDHVGQSRDERDRAQRELQAQAGFTAKRTRLLDELARRERVAHEAAEEAQRDEQSADTWRAA